jgi:steroid delta-isomerase-like uncharacterized protein
MTEPREVVEQLLAAINAHDLPACARLMADDARLVAATGRVLDLGGMGRLLAGTYRALPDASVRVERWVVEGDIVVTEEVLEGTHEGTFAGLPASGRRLAIPMVHVTRVSGDRIVERVTYHDTAAVLRQLEDAVS